MPTQTFEPLQSKKCRPCEGGIEKLTPQEAADNLQVLPRLAIQPGRLTAGEGVARQELHGRHRLH